MPAPFPTGAIHTDFGPNIPSNDENPMSQGGEWIRGIYDYGLQIRDGVAIPTQEFFVNGMVYVRHVFRAPCDAWACISGGGLGAANESFRVYFWLNSPTSAVGYLSAWGGGIGKDLFMRRYDGDTGSWTTLGVITGVVKPTKIGLRITASTVEQWGESSGVWSLRQSFGDTSHRGIFYAAIGMEEQGSVGNVGMGCFGALGINRQFFYRWVRAQKGVVPA